MCPTRVLDFDQRFPANFAMLSQSVDIQPPSERVVTVTCEYIYCVFVFFLPLIGE